MCVNRPVTFHVRYALLFFVIIINALLLEDMNKHESARIL